MAIETWQQWLRAVWTSGPSHTRRKQRVARLAAIEDLEHRAMLTAPVVIDASANPDEDVAYPGTVALLGSDADGNPLTYAVVANPSHGTLTFNATGVFLYTPTLNYNGPDSFTFKANDGTSDSNIGTISLTVSPVNDALKLTFPSATTKIPRNSSTTRIDPAAVVVDVDDNVNFANTKIRALVSSGNSNGDYQKGRIALKIVDQGSGAGLVHVVGTNIYYNGDDTHPIATFTGGTLGRSLQIKFRSTADIFSVNAVLRQIGMQASKKATSISSTAGIGIRLVDVTVSAGGQTTLATKTVSVV